MNTQPALERCLAFINCQLQPNARPPFASATARPRRAVTISRQAGCGAHAIAEKLASYLQAAGPKESVPWTVWDRDLEKKVLQDHHLPQRLARFMPEDHVSEMADIMEELCGLHPPSWILVRQTADTILHLAELGNVILIGRGSNIITTRLDHVFHVRLVGSLERRLGRVQKSNHLSRKSALKFIGLEDRGRRRYLKKYFGKNIDDPLLYHLVINTDLVSCEKAARIITDAVLG